MSTSTLYERAGGEETLRAVLRTFYDLVFADVMIGFFFAKADKERLVEKELELAARALGHKEAPYTGLPLREAHARHPILGGHFERRQVLLAQAIDAHGVPAEVKEAWLAHNRALRKLVTADEGTDCDHDKTRS